MHNLQDARSCSHEAVGVLACSRGVPRGDGGLRVDRVERDRVIACVERRLKSEHELHRLPQEGPNGHRRQRSRRDRVDTRREQFAAYGDRRTVSACWAARTRCRRRGRVANARRNRRGRAGLRAGSTDPFGRSGSVRSCSKASRHAAARQASVEFDHCQKILRPLLKGRDASVCFEPGGAADESWSCERIPPGVNGTRAWPTWDYTVVSCISHAWTPTRLRSWPWARRRRVVGMIDEGVDGAYRLEVIFPLGGPSRLPPWGQMRWPRLGALRPARLLRGRHCAGDRRRCDGLHGRSGPRGRLGAALDRSGCER